jgi:putative endonuclease
MNTWSVYLLRCSDGSLYTGIATDVSRRLAEHAQGDKGAKYLRGRGPLELVYHREIGDRSLASKIEYRLKRLPKEYKEDLARLPARIEELVNQCAPQALDAGIDAQ